MKRKYLKLSIFGAALTAAVLAGTITLPFILLNKNNQSNKIIEPNQKAGDSDYSDELDYIKKDAEKQADVENTVESIKFVDVGFNAHHSAVIVTKVDKSTFLYMWGKNDVGQLGFSANSTANSTPTLVNPTYFSASRIKKVLLSEKFSAALLEDGSLYMWGDNGHGQLGNNSYTSTSTPAKVTINSTSPIAQIALGMYHSAALLDDGSLYTWGYNSSGQLGNGSTTSALIPTLVNFAGFADKKIKRILFGSNYSAALTQDGSLYMWGHNAYGQLGNGTKDNAIVPTKIIIPNSGSNKVIQVAASIFHSAVILEDNSMYMCGSNGSGQLGNNTTTESINFVKVDDTNFNGKTISKISLGYQFSSSLLEDGSLYMWGTNGYGQLGNGLTSRSLIPTPVDTTNFNSKKISEIWASYQHSQVILDDGSFYMWGDNRYGQLGNTKNNGTSNPNPIPTWMSQLGKDSHIIANSTLTAKEAVNNLWIDNKLNLTGFKNSFNLNNIPDVADQTFTMAAKPTYDNQTGTLTMKVGIKYFYDENGLIITNTAATAMVVTGFMPSLTKISVKTNSKTDIVVDKWLDSVKELTYIDRWKLEDYLLLEQVPQGAAFTITGITQNLQTGVLKFNITSSLTTKQDGSLTGESDPFAITLNLTPRITTLTTRTDYNKIAVDKFKDLIFDSNGIANIDEIKKYIKYDATVEGATLNLKPNSYVINTSMGTAKFTVFFDKYYDTTGAEKSQTASALTKSFDVSLQLLPMATVITSKASYTPTHRVDRFISAFTDANGIVTNETVLKQYVDLQNLPTGYTLKVSNVNIIDPIDGTMSFDLIASKYNDKNFIPQENGTFPIQLVKLLPKYPTTDITAKAEGDYDDTVRLDRFINLFAPAAGGVVTDLNKLGEFLDLVSIPETATVTVNNIVMTNATGKITFNVIVDKYYDVNSDLKTANKTFPVTLYLGIKYIPTDITANTNIVYPERIDRFETKINELSGTPELQTYLQTKYITIIGDLPKNTTFSVANIVSDLDTGIMNLDLIASDYYDENSDPQKIKTFALTLGLGIKYAPTVLVAKAKADLGSERIDRFAHTIAMFTNQDLKNYLEDYVDGIETLAVGSSLVASNIVKNENTGIISFDVSTDRYYDADSDFKATTETWSISLELTVKLTPTTIEAKTEDFTNIRVDSLIPSFTNDQLVVTNRDELNKYVNITGLPADTQLSIKDPNMSFSTGVITFKIVADKFYDGEADLIMSRSHEYVITLNLGIKYQPTVIKAIKGYVQTENVKTFTDQIKTLTGDALKTYLATYIQTTGDLPADAVMSIDTNTVTYDEDTGAVSFNLLVDKYYDADGSLKTNGTFKIRLCLAH